MFIHHARIYLHHTDAAGRLFFAQQFYLIHEAKEHFLESLGLRMKELLEHPVVTFPLVHAESDYKAVLVAGDEIDISVGIEKIGETSVVFQFTILKAGVLAGTAKTVSVCADKVTNKKAPIPVEWRKKFETVL
jgi:1,4-dihydroxy-2-naphthoyl-CoA hydrolase